jgi:transcriptional regulator
MYTPPAFRIEDVAEIAAWIRAARLAILVSTGADGQPAATHLPLLLSEDGAVIEGHLARANPQWRGLSRALAIFPGPEAYVSPSWYPSKREHGRVVPTWNYVAVHAEGPVELVEEPDALHALVDRLTRAHEGRRAEPWAVDDAPAPFVASQLKGIVGLRLRIERLTAKKKMSQNRSEADRAGVAAGLAAEGEPAAALLQPPG